jgi:hypothetical protein
VDHASRLLGGALVSHAPQRIHNRKRWCQRSCCAA